MAIRILHRRFRIPPVLGAFQEGKPCVLRVLSMQVRPAASSRLAEARRGLAVHRLRLGLSAAYPERPAQRVLLSLPSSGFPANVAGFAANPALSLLNEF